jgi:hypothetical protein
MNGRLDAVLVVVTESPRLVEDHVHRSDRSRPR